eukprot:CAMPEP_0206136192 /NCGR_PEP_ID=MMETSP1473-20131121/1428_1 /ASSEMBLY_ACC=CAM_ASM_001109 /TAXON_ID=1461547 /ORGANISM="Stichococcus sp, Strain RCC1054" /LENGTH=34 /DNA_ID= /DNA_START= /DNA_END= /DNA_ORIENTATION=
MDHGETDHGETKHECMVGWAEALTISEGLTRNLV